MSSRENKSTAFHFHMKKEFKLTTDDKQQTIDGKINENITYRDTSENGYIPNVLDFAYKQDFWSCYMQLPMENSLNLLQHLQI